ncbi:hypothetical protein BaRGS_00036578 [Batillaria attramentaria]|uniref:Uncharacterized protein n=1 Tax=Batillaria attramentaria TaxID=370345 RepID=A0ABD0JBC2_9CAEN
MIQPPKYNIQAKPAPDHLPREAGERALRGRKVTSAPLVQYNTNLPRGGGSTALRLHNPPTKLDNKSRGRIEGEKVLRLRSPKHSKASYKLSSDDSAALRKMQPSQMRSCCLVIDANLLQATSRQHSNKL